MFAEEPLRDALDERWFRLASGDGRRRLRQGVPALQAGPRAVGLEPPLHSTFASVAGDLRA
jgi:hypothetical protein